MVFFSDVSKKYDKTNTLALDRVSFYIEKGEFVFIIGSSGAGKSTLTKLMLAEEQLTDGSITINGTDVGSLKNKDIPHYRRSIGMVFQDFRLLNNKTVYENVAFAMELLLLVRLVWLRLLRFLLDVISVILKVWNSQRKSSSFLPISVVSIRKATN